MKIYADVLFAINFSMDLISLFITSLILRRKASKKRFLLSAAMGGLYGVLAVILPLNTITSGIFSVIVSLIMCYISFFEKSIKRLTGLYIIYWGASACLGGIMSVLYSFLNKLLAEYIENFSYSNVYTGARFFVVAILSILISIILSRFFTTEKSIKFAKISVKIDKKEFELNALCDSGNLLTEPISGKSVILVSEKSDLANEINKIPDIYKRYIPFSSVGGEGMIKGVLPKLLIVNGVQRDAIIAPISKRDFAGYEACVSMALV